MKSLSMPGPIRVPRPAATMTAAVMSLKRRRARKDRARLEGWRQAHDVAQAMPGWNGNGDYGLAGFFSSSFLPLSAGAFALSAFRTVSERSSLEPTRLVYTTTGVWFNERAAVSRTVW